MKAVLRATTIVVAALCLSTNVSHTQEGVSAWKSVWKMELSTEPDRAPLRSIHVTMTNRGGQPLEGHNLLLNIYIDQTMYGWAADPKIRSEKLEIPVGQTITRTLHVDRLEFADTQGERIEPDIALEYLSGRQWHTFATLTDLKTPKPSFESSYLIWSTKLEVEPPDVNGRGRPSN